MRQINKILKIMIIGPPNVHKESRQLQVQQMIPCHFLYF